MQLNLNGVLLDGSTPVTTTPARQDLVVYRGVDTIIQVTVLTSSGAVPTLTSYTATLTVKDRLLPVQGTPKLSNTYTGTFAANVITFTIPGTDLKNMNLVGYWYDVFISSPTNKRDEVVPTGTMTVNQAIGA